MISNFSKNSMWLMLGFNISSIANRLDSKSYETIHYPIFLAIIVAICLFLTRGK